MQVACPKKLTTLFFRALQVGCVLPAEVPVAELVDERQRREAEEEARKAEEERMRDLLPSDAAPKAAMVNIPTVFSSIFRSVQAHASSG